jgi:hypothetical protein
MPSHRGEQLGGASFQDLRGNDTDDSGNDQQ